MKQLNAIEVLNKALAILWNGVGSKGFGPDDKEYFACHAVAKASGGEYGSRDTDNHPVVKALYERITSYIKGHDHVRGYLTFELNKINPTNEELQAFRKSMLEEILAEYVLAAERNDKAIEVLDKAIELLVDGEVYFGCSAVKDAAATITGVNRWEVVEKTVAGEIVARISKYIGGHTIIETYLADVHGLKGLPEPELKARRVKMLQEIRQEYVRKPVLNEMIAILTNVRLQRIDGTSKSLFVCDNVNNVANRGYSDAAATAIRADINARIEGKWGVEEFLGLPNIKFHDEGTGLYLGQWGNVTEEAKAFRLTMIEELLARYKAALVAA